MPSKEERKQKFFIYYVHSFGELLIQDCDLHFAGGHRMGMNKCNPKLKDFEIYRTMSYQLNTFF